MRINLAKQKVRAGQSIHGVLVHWPSPQLVELIGWLGFDFVLIDTEHSAITLGDVEAMARAADLTGLCAIAKATTHEPEQIVRFLDAGCLGLQVPHVQSAAMAREAVSAAKFPPLGVRGLAPSRATQYGLHKFAEYVQSQNEQTLLIAMVEDEPGVANLEAIAATDGIDAVYFGKVDYSNALGLAGQTEHPLVKAAAERHATACKAAGKVIGVAPASGQVARQLSLEHPHYFITIANRFFTQAAQAYLDGTKG